MSILEAVTGKDTTFISIMEDSTLDMGSYFGKPKKSEASDGFKQYTSALAPITEEPVPRSVKPPRSGSKKLQAIAAGGFGKQASTSNLTLIGHKNTGSRRNLTVQKPNSIGLKQRKAKSTIRGRSNGANHSLYNTPNDPLQGGYAVDARSIDEEVDALLRTADRAQKDAEGFGRVFSETDRLDDMHRNGDAEDILAYSEQILNQFKKQQSDAKSAGKAHVTLKKKQSNSQLL